MKLSDADTKNSKNDQFSSDLDNRKRDEPDDVNNPVSLIKIMNNIRDLCDIYIKSK